MLLWTGPAVGAVGKRGSPLSPKSTRNDRISAVSVTPYCTQSFFDTLTAAEPPRLTTFACPETTRSVARFCSARRCASRGSLRSSSLWVACCLLVSGAADGAAVADPGTTAAMSAKAAAPPKTPVTRLFTKVLHEGGSDAVLVRTSVGRTTTNVGSQALVTPRTESPHQALNAT